MNLNEAKEILKDNGYILEGSLSIKDKIVNARQFNGKTVWTEKSAMEYVKQALKILAKDKVVLDILPTNVPDTIRLSYSDSSWDIDYIWYYNEDYLTRQAFKDGERCAVKKISLKKKSLLQYIKEEFYL